MKKNLTEDIKKSIKLDLGKLPKGEYKNIFDNSEPNLNFAQNDIPEEAEEELKKEKIKINKNEYMIRVIDIIIEDEGKFMLSGNTLFKIY